MATMEDVAREANVSVSTVSHVLNGTRKVSPATVEAVREAIRKTGYVPNTLAQALAGAASRTIGVAISALTNHYFSETVRAIEAECARRGLMMFLADTHDDPGQELRVVQALHQRRVDGIILAPTVGPERRALDYLETARIPSVMVDRITTGRFDQIGVENLESIASLVAHLVGHGHRRIGFVSGAPDIPTSVERLDGYRLALDRAGLPFDAELVRCGHSDKEPARRAVHALLALPEPPSAITVSNNLMMIGAMHALREADVAVPGRMALVGFDDFDWAEYVSPRLTVLAQPLEEIGTRAVDLLMRRIAEPGGDYSVHRLAPALRIRDSCGCSG
ncbi:LacI family DNA-binding transcriptional regulator [Burkholderia gladioli]|uniref:LacI family DNA-binding transcriptional regulator n=1 Tax=Burkholderia gladioli TaxID=28095 RepID=UPI00163F3C23|nr:LacI family DNA-binding transcriptional regulator [Burkholderia gladioli]